MILNFGFFCTHVLQDVINLLIKLKRRKLKKLFVMQINLFVGSFSLLKKVSEPLTSVQSINDLWRWTDDNHD